MTKTRFRNTLTAGKLRKATPTRGLARDPWRILLRFTEAGGLASVAGREVLATLTLPEMARILGAVPASVLEDPDDYNALLRVKKLLERQPDSYPVSEKAGS
jgi:hypothetical protein